MVHLKVEMLPKGKYTKIMMRKMGPFRILQKCGTNAYKVELPPDIGLSNIFNVSDLYPYKGSIVCDAGATHEAEVPTGLPKKSSPEVESLLDIKIMKETRRKTYYQYHIKWKRKPMEDATWVTEKDLNKMELKVEGLPTQET